jgi:death-on-curing protein
MTKRPTFLTVEQVLAIHRRVIEEFGGDAAVMDDGLLESAVMMAAAQYAGEFLHPDIPAMAAAYLFHLCRNHAFVDGNKRTALAAAEVFLLLNGWRLDATNRQLEQLTLRLAEGTLGKDEVTAFFRRRAASAPP